MFHIGRCGSGVLADLMEQHRSIAWDGELLKPRRFHRQLGFPVRHLRPGSPARARALLMIVRKRLAAADPATAYGFETKFFHLEREGVGVDQFLGLVRNEGVDRFVVLRRRNTLHTVVSGLLAARAGRHHETAPTPRPEPIVIDPDNIALDRTITPLVDLLDRWERNYADLEQRLSGDSTLTLTFEDHVAEDPTIGYERLCEFLGVGVTPAEVRFSRTGSFPLDTLVANLDAVRRTLESTSYAWMVDQ